MAGSRATFVSGMAGRGPAVPILSEPYLQLVPSRPISSQWKRPMLSCPGSVLMALLPLRQRAVEQALQRQRSYVLSLMVITW